MSGNKRILIAAIVVTLILAAFNYTFMISMQMPSWTTIIVGSFVTVAVLFVLFKAFEKIL